MTAPYRRYRPTSVPHDDVLAILDAARLVPTAGNQQPWIFLVIRDRERLDVLQDSALEWYMTRAQQSLGIDSERVATTRRRVQQALDGALSAPVYVAVLVDATAQYPDYVTYDGTLAAGTLMIAARAFGYGTGFFTTFFPSDRMNDFLAIPDQYVLICFTPIGTPEAWPDMSKKKPLDEVVVLDSLPYLAG